MSGPLVSIIIPAYNQQPHFLREAVESALTSATGMSRSLSPTIIRRTIRSPPWTKSAIHA